VTPRCCGGSVILLALFTLGARPLPKLKPEPIPILPAEEVWAVQFDAAPAANAWMDDERVYVGFQVEGVRALTRRTGDILWEEPFDITQPPLTVQDRLLVALPDQIRALDPRTGRELWSRPLVRPVAVPMIAVAGAALLIDDAGSLIALRPTDGEELWRKPLGTFCRHAPAVLGDTAVVLTLEDGRVLALDTTRGDPLWERRPGGALSAPAAARDRVLVGTSNNEFFALDARSGKERWRWRTGGDVVGAAAAGDRVYFVSLDNILRAVDRDSGNQLWKAAISSRPAAPPVAFDDVVVLAAVAPRVDAWNARTGAALGTLTAPTDLAGVPLIDTTPRPFEVAIVALTRDGRLMALRPTGLMFPDPPLLPLLKLPGRELPREPRPGAARLP
jgi:outer membrane protein assembly factor BamB